ncbi:EF-hand domain-containing protein [Novosphingobium flavum]|uniref:EF-hand domain-containing protein n=1 Tax=Novosphingobium flavum TaxID=1778672 RepID=A0A7X1FP42_9SPHN|nr:EF-hand domain-containing protein [Novosphingobium flavum]MBC2664383.1 EF-hand domain-containing protein [Novosphingobium flavum]
MIQMNRKMLLPAVAVAAISFGIVAPAFAQMGPGMMNDPYGDGTVTRAEAEAQAAERFDKIDANKNGVLDPEEMAAMRPARPAGAPAGGPEGGPPPGAGQPRGGPGGPGGGMMRQADKNGDGKIDKAEFVAAQLARFDQMDENHDGKATKEERTNFFEDMRARMMMRMGGGGGGQ